MAKNDLNDLRDKILRKMNENKGVRDKDELKPPKNLEKDFKVRFVVLPGLNAGDTYAGDKVADASDSTDDEFFVSNGKHWMAKKPYECPRAHRTGMCPLCELGFELMDGESKAKRSEIAKDYLANESWAMNIYVTNDENNPEEYRDRVMWYNAGKTIQDMLKKCLANDPESIDPEDPQAHGIFFHPESCYVFQFCAVPSGGYPDYKSSKFLVSQSTGPMKLQDVLSRYKSKHNAQEILDMRFSLKKKFDVPNIEELNRIVRNLKAGTETIEPYDDRPKQVNKNSRTVETPEIHESIEKANKKPKEEPKKVIDIDDEEIDSRLNEILGDDDEIEEKNR